MINYIFETEDIVKYLNERRLVKQYKKAKQYILLWKFSNVDFKKREPKELWIWYFRINKKYRAYWRFDWVVLIIFRIDDHQ